MLMQIPEWEVRFRIDYGHHGIEPTDLVLVCSEPDLEAVVKTLRRSGSDDIHMTRVVYPQIPEPPAATKGRRDA